MQAFVAAVSGAHLAIAATAADISKVVDTDCEKIVCNPNNPLELALALKAAVPAELVMIHDSQRPLTGLSQFEDVYAGLTAEIDAVRPVSPFAETLKSVTADNFIDQTIDRNSMMRISTPELIRFAAIGFESQESTWFVPLNDSAKIAVVEAKPESARINSDKEIDLMSYLFDWKK